MLSCTINMYALPWHEGGLMCVVELRNYSRPYMLHAVLVVSHLCCRDKLT